MDSSWPLICGFFKTALSRQIAEACRIQKLGEEIILNSKDEFNRCKIRRLVINEDHTRGSKDSKEEEEESEDREIVDQGWEMERIQSRRIQELRGVVNLERGIARSPPRKRTGELQDTEKRSNMKRWKYPPLEDNWGEEVDNGEAVLVGTAPTTLQDPVECPPCSSE